MGLAVVSPCCLDLQTVDEEWMLHVAVLLRSVPRPDPARTTAAPAGVPEGIVDVVRLHLLKVLASYDHPFGGLVVRFISHLEFEYSPAQRARAGTHSGCLFDYVYCALITI